MPNKRVAVYLNHPSHYYVFRIFINLLKKKGYLIKVYVKEKDILKEILNVEGQEYSLIFKNKISNGFLHMVFNVVRKNLALYRELRCFKPDFMVSCGSDVAQVGCLLGIPSFVMNDDDAKVVPYSAIAGWPFAKRIFAPKSCNMGYWRRKTITYNGYQKLFYLHPRYFSPQRGIVEKYIKGDKPYFLIRSVSLTAHHDRNIRGLSNELVKKLIQKLSVYGNVYLSSERDLPASLEGYCLKINPRDIHHLLYYAGLIIADSQSMVQEAAILGTPSLRFNDFVGRIGVMEELEHKYGIAFGISPDNPDMLLKKAEELAGSLNNGQYRLKAEKMVEEMIDPTALLLWYIENYPDSQHILDKDPEYAEKFK